MRAYIKLFKSFILRALAREKLRAGITALGISFGVGVMVAVRLANAGALASFRTATESVAGETSLQITGTAGRFDELKLREVDWLREYGWVSPVVEGYAVLAPGTPAASPGEFLQVLGVDMLRDRALRRYRLLRLNADPQETGVGDFLALLSDPKAIILSETFARRHGLAIGHSLPLVMGDTIREFTIRGLLLNEGPARALAGNFAVMDIAAAQWAFGRIGQLDRLDVKLHRNRSLEQVEGDIAGRLPAGLSLARPEDRYGQVEKMIAAFHFNLNALGSIALLVGLFLIYNTVATSVITRREEIGTLRAIGAGRLMILSLFLGEALLLALAGTVVGLGLGRLMAGAAVQATATTVQTFYIASAATQAASQRLLGWSEIVLAFAVALPLAMTAAAVPALEAAGVQPVEAIRGAERMGRSRRPPRKYMAMALSFFALGYAFSRVGPWNGLPVFGYAAALALMFGGAFLVPSVLWIVCRAGGQRLRPVFVAAKLAAANLGGAIPRVSISVAALAVSLAMMVAISIMIESFRETVSYWVDQTLKADLYARPLTRASVTTGGEIDHEAVARLQADPSVAAIDAFTAQPVSYQGNLITLGAGDFAVLIEHGRLLFKTPRDARDRLRQAIGRDRVVVSESFALRFNKAVGDTVELPTPAGYRPFQVAAVYYDYSSNRGTVVMDVGTYARYFNGDGLRTDGPPSQRPGSLSIYLRPNADPDAVRERLERTVGDRYRLVFTTNRGVRREVIRIFNSTFAITYALELIAIVVAGLGVISTLITLILERRRETAVLSFLGATRAQIRRMVVIEAALIGGVSQAVGTFIGGMLSLVLIYVINVQSFGWTIQFHFPALFLFQLMLLILVVSALAGLYPAARAARGMAVQAVRGE